MEYAAVNVNDIVLLESSLKHLKKTARIVGIDLTGIEFNLDTGFDSKRNRKIIWNAKMKPNIPENIRNRDASKPKRGRPRHYDIKSYKKRFTVERTFAWEDAYRSMVIRYDRKDSNYFGRKLLAYTLTNLRYFCGRSQ
jgi:transposase